MMFEGMRPRLALLRRDKCSAIVAGLVHSVPPGCLAVSHGGTSDWSAGAHSRTILSMRCWSASVVTVAIMRFFRAASYRLASPQPYARARARVPYTPYAARTDAPQEQH